MDTLKELPHTGRRHNDGHAGPTTVTGARPRGPDLLSAPNSLHCPRHFHAVWPSIVPLGVSRRM
jgi:hypothetical protein